MLSYTEKTLMPINVHWYDAEQTIIRYEFQGRWSWDDLYEAVKTVERMVKPLAHRFDVIFNVKHTIGMPSGAIGHIRGLSGNTDEHWGMGVMVGGSTFFRTMMQIFLKLNPKFQDRYTLAESDEDAVRVIRNRRAQDAASTPR
jgi:hypothetical protein